jgi:glutathione transport system substrate-binding protein
MKTHRISLVVALLSASIALPALLRAQTARPKDGGVLKFGTAKGIKALNPFVNTRSTEHSVRTLLYEPLVIFDEKSEIIPYLAESWTISKDGKSYTFNLRKGVRFHNGSEMTAEDIKWGFDYTLNPKNYAYGREMLNNVASLEIVDSHTVRFNLKNPQAAFLAAMGTIQTFFAVAKGSIKEGEKAPSAFPPGTGPYQFLEWKSAEHLRLKKFAHYWQKGIPHMDEIVIKPVEEGEVRFASLRAGDLQVAERMPMHHALAVRKGEYKDLGAAPASAGGLRAYLFNVQIPPFDNVKLRQAIAYSIDKREMLNGAFWGWGAIINQKMEPESNWYFPIPERKRDVAKARQLLREAGYPSGLTIRIHCRKGNEDEVQILQRQLLGAGIKVELDLHDPVSYMTKMRRGEAGFATFGGDIYPDPDLNSYGDFHTEVVAKGSRDRQNFFNYSNPRVDRLFEEARVSVDAKKRYDLYKEAFQIIDEEVPVIYSLLVPYVFLYRNEVKGFKADSQARYFASGKLGFPTAWLEK